MENKAKTSKPRPKTRAKFTKGKSDKVSREFSDRPEARHDNDSSWYTVNGQLLKDVSSFSFNTALGATLNITGIDHDYKRLNFESRLPGALSILTVPTVGISNGNDAPVNIAARNIYSYVRHANSGHSNYDPADLMIYLLSMDSIYTYWSYLVRAYGVAQVFSQTNRYVGDSYLTAMGINPGDLRKNLADFRAFINMYAVKASVFCVPKTMSYFVRHSWMYSNIYKDEDTNKAQVYMYVPAFLYQYAVSAATGAGMLSTVQVAANVDNHGVIQGVRLLSVGELVDIGWALLYGVMQQEDTGIMSGDILKAYGAENLWKLTQLPEDYAVFPVFSEEVLAQIHNTDFASTVIYMVNPEDPTHFKIDFHGLDVTQNTEVGGGQLKFGPVFGYGTHLCHDRLLDFWKEDPSPEDVIVATRNKLNASYETAHAGGTRAVSLATCGSEIALMGVMWTINDLGITQATPMYNWDSAYNTMAFQPLSKFNEFPLYYITSTSTGEILSIVGEMDTYTVLTGWEVEQLHTTALLSMFGVPYIK